MAVSCLAARLLFVATLAASVGPVRAEPPPNVVIVLVDTVRADHVGSYGAQRATSASFDAFAREHTLFLNAYSPSPWTRPAVASLFTGLYPQRHGVQMRADRLSSNLPTLAALLGQRGYQTTCITTNPHVTETWGMTRGFDRLVSLMPNPHRMKAGNDANLVYHRLREVLPELREPFLLYVHLIDPHYPYEPPPEDLVALGLPRQTKSWAALYDGELRYADRMVGRMLHALAREGLTERSVIVWTSDHGEEFHEHGSTGHGKTVYQEVVRVPLAIALPPQLDRLWRSGERRRPCARVESNVSLVDLVPTLLSMTGVAAPPDLDGEDLSPTFACQAMPTRPLFFSVEKERGSYAAVLVEQSKLIVDRQRANQQLFAIDQDPFEQGSGVDGSAEATALREHLAALLESFEWSARPGLHLELAGVEEAPGRHELVVWLRTDGRFVDVRGRGFEAGDRFRLGDDDRFIRVDVTLAAVWHRSPKHVWVQDRDELVFQLEPPEATVTLTVQEDGRRAPLSRLRFPRLPRARWPLTVTRDDLIARGRPSLVDRRREGIYLYGQAAAAAETVPAISQDIEAALRALGYIQ